MRCQKCGTDSAFEDGENGPIMCSRCDANILTISGIFGFFVWFLIISYIWFS